MTYKLRANELPPILLGYVGLEETTLCDFPCYIVNMLVLQLGIITTQNGRTQKLTELSSK